MSDGSERELASMPPECVLGPFFNTFNSSVAAEARRSMFMVDREGPRRAGRVLELDSLLVDVEGWSEWVSGFSIDSVVDRAEDDNECIGSSPEVFRESASAENGMEIAADADTGVAPTGAEPIGTETGFVCGSGVTWCVATTFDKFLFRREFGLVCILRWRVSSSSREKRLLHPGKEHKWGFSPVWVLMWRV